MRPREQPPGYVRELTAGVLKGGRPSKGIRSSRSTCRHAANRRGTARSRRAFGIGFGLPLLAISLLAQGRQAALLRAFTRHDAVVSRVAGLVLVAVGAWDLSVNLPFALLYRGA